MPTKIDGVVQIEIEPHRDERGFFARTWCINEFREAGLNASPVQSSVSFSSKKATLRGMHYQASPHAECKLVRVTRGRVFDVALDLRPKSPTFRQWVGVELSENNGKMLYVGEGIAHGFVTLDDATEVHYQMSEFYHPASARGVRFDDPAFGIDWPIPPITMSEKDRAYPDFCEF